MLWWWPDETRTPTPGLTAPEWFPLTTWTLPPVWEVDPDDYVVFKPLAMNGYCHPIVEKRLGEKARKLIYASGGSARTNSTIRLTVGS